MGSGFISHTSGERHKAEAGAAPRILGSTTVAAVAEATVRALAHSPPLAVVNSVPLSGLRLIEGASPRAADALTDALSHEYMKKIANARKK